jgi:lysozyme family protein
MANYELILDHIKKWEGATSADPRDTCSDVPSDVLATSGKFAGKPIHTNKGVCYKTWVASAKALGFDPSGKAFVNMTTRQWQQIVKLIFWDAMHLDTLKSQNIAELMLEVRWGSGAGGQGKIFFKELQRLVGLTGSDLDGFVGRKTIDAVNRYISVKGNEAKLYKALWDFRYNQLDKLGQKSTYAWARDGWLNRMKSLLDRSTNFVMDNPKTFGLIGVLLLVGVSYGVYKYVLPKIA